VRVLRRTGVEVLPSRTVTASSASDTTRRCARPGCAAWPAATLSYRYAEKRTVIVPLSGTRPPQTYDLCGPHADRTRPPRGWILEDRRTASVRPALPPEPAAPASEPTSHPSGVPLQLDLGQIAGGQPTATW
jgi:hypothetical protein